MLENTKVLRILESLEMPAASTESICVAEHGEHDTLTIELDLNGKHPGLLDVPGIPERLSQRMKFTIFNAKKYQNTGGYCPADDEVSRSIYIQHIWEAFETVLFLDILSKGNKENIVIDVGANIGWYSILAGLKGYGVAAVEPDADVYPVLYQNVVQNDLTNIFTCRAWVNERTPQLTSEAETVEFLKVDIEGMEKFAADMCEKLFAAGKINYALFEISPFFNDTYPDLVERIAGYGYRVFQVPTKGFEHLQEYEDEPLATLKKYCEVKAESRREFVASIRQEDFIFIKSELV